MLAVALQGPIALSISNAIERNKAEYYLQLKTAQRSNAISPWIEYFLNLLLEAQTLAQDTIKFVLKKAQYFDRYGAYLNDRQRKVILRMFEAGEGGFTGGMSAKKYVSLTGTSKATATRDLQELEKKGALSRQGQGRSVRYQLRFEEE